MTIAFTPTPGAAKINTTGEGEWALTGVDPTNPGVKITGDGNAFIRFGGGGVTCNAQNGVQLARSGKEIWRLDRKDTHIAVCGSPSTRLTIVPGKAEWR